MRNTVLAAHGLEEMLCGRVIQARGPLEYAIVDWLDVRDSRLSNYPRRWNGAPSQEFLVIRQHHDTGERSLDLALSPVCTTFSEGAARQRSEHREGK